MRKISPLKAIAMAIFFLAIMLTSGCAKKADNPPKAADNTPPTRYQMRGEVLRLDPSLHIAVIKGEKIEGWMEAMTMEYPIRDLQEFQKLKAGDKIQATVFVKGDDYWVGEIQNAPAASSDAPPPSAPGESKK